MVIKYKPRKKKPLKNIHDHGRIGHLQIHFSLYFKARLHVKSLLGISVFIHIIESRTTEITIRTFAPGLTMKRACRGQLTSFRRMRHKTMAGFVIQ